MKIDMKRIVLFLAYTVGLISCISNELDTPDELYSDKVDKERLIFSASYGNDTKTHLINSTEVWWNSNEIISINGEHFWSTNEEPAPIAEFEGEVEPAETYIAVYPGIKMFEWNREEQMYYIEISDMQNAVNGTFDNETNLSAAKTSSDNMNLHFHNLLGYVAFDITADDLNLRKLTVETMAGEPLSGICNLIWDDEKPVLNSIDEHGGSSVHLRFDDEDKTGKYYIAMLPGTYSKGLTFRFEDNDDRYSILKISESITMEAGKIMNLGEIKDLSFKHDHELLLKKQASALRNIYVDCNGNKWKNNTNWMSEAPIDEWYGIETDEMGYVTNIDLSSNNLVGHMYLDCASDFKRLESFNFNDNAIEEFYIKGNKLIKQAEFKNWCTRNLDIHDIPNVEIDDCDGLEHLYTHCETFVLKNCALTLGDHIMDINAKDAYVYNCQMESCGINSETLVFEESATNNLWYAYTSKQLEIVDSYCSTICNANFTDETIIILNNAALWRSNWDEYSFKILTCSIEGKDWNDLFDEESDYTYSEEVILMRLYKQTNGSKWLNNTNWGTEKPLNEWYGITTDNEGFITSIDLHDNGLSAISINLNLVGLSRLNTINISGNEFGQLRIIGNQVMEDITLRECASESIYIDNIEKVMIENCDSLSIIDGECKNLVVKDCAFKHDAQTPFYISPKDVHIQGCDMHSCGVSSETLRFEDSSTYDTWHCYTSEKLEIINSHCSTICSWDFDENADIILDNATLWRSNWDEHSLVTLNCTIKGSGWDAIFK